MLKIKKTNKIILAIFLVLGLFLITGIAHAFFAGVIYGWVSAVLDALDFIDTAILKMLVTVLLWGFISSAFVFLGANLIQWIISVPVGLSESQIVMEGWYFVLGLTNIFLVLSLIFIALAHILQLESFKLKKALPKLIIVILFVNFSRLIVGMAVDMAQFFINTFLNVWGSNFVEMSLVPLRASLGSLMNVFLVTVLGYIASAFTVFGSVFALAYILSNVLVGNLLGSIFEIVFLCAVNILMGMMFFLYFVLFAMRIAALWILTIFSPLAFFALVFDKTRGYAKKWFIAVIQWAFIGVVALFLFGLISALFASHFQTGANLAPPTDWKLSIVPGFPVVRLRAPIFQYLFMLVFLFFAYQASKQYTPTAAKQVVGMIEGQVKSLGGAAGIVNRLQKGAKRGASAIARRTMRGQVAKFQDMAATPTRTAKGGFLRTNEGKFRFLNPQQRRRTGQALLNVTREADRTIYNETKAEAEKMDENQLQAAIHSSKAGADPAVRAAYISTAAKKGALKNLADPKKSGDATISKEQIVQAHAMASQMGDKETRENLEKGFVKDLESSFLANLKATLSEVEFKNLELNLKENYQGKYANKIIDGIKNKDDMKALQKGWEEDRMLRRQSLKSWGPQQWKDLARTASKETIATLDKAKNRMLDSTKEDEGVNFFIKNNNVESLRYWATNGGRFGYSTHKKATQEELNSEDFRAKVRRIEKNQEAERKAKKETETAKQYGEFLKRVEKKKEPPGEYMTGGKKYKSMKDWQPPGYSQKKKTSKKDRPPPGTTK